MNYKTLGLGLGIFSLGLAAVELLGSKKIAKALDAEGHEGLIKAYGVREAVAGVGLLQSPAHSARVWNRVLGDGMDIATLGAALRNAPRNKAVWASLGFVIGATVLDVAVALGLDRTTGKTLPQGA
jgi:hypothetical protein